MKQDDSIGEPGTMTSNVTYGDPPYTGDPLGVANVAYAAGRLPETYVYAAPFEPGPPPNPFEPVAPSVIITTPCNHAEEFKRPEEHLCRIEQRLRDMTDWFGAALKVREACDEMLKRLGEQGKQP